MSDTSNDTDDLVNDLLQGLISDPLKPETPEDAFIRHFTGGKAPKSANLIYWLRVQFGLYDRFAEYGLHTAAYGTTGDLKRVHITKISRVIIEHYLMQNHPHWFQSAMAGRVAADIEQVIDRLLKEENISKAIFSGNRS